MYLLNYIYFLIITLLGLKFLTMKRGVMVNPLNREQKMVMDGPEMFWVLTFSTGLLALSAPGALDLMAIRLMVLEIFCIVGLFICKRSPQWSPAIVLYLLYIVCLSWNDDYDVFSNRQYYGIIGICSAVDGRWIFYM